MFFLRRGVDDNTTKSKVNGFSDPQRLPYTYCNTINYLHLINNSNNKLRPIN